MVKTSEYYNDNLKDTKWLGEVVNNEDPLLEQRIKIRVFGKFDELLEEDIPWAHPKQNDNAGSSTGGGRYNVPKVGNIVSVTFDNGNIYHPEYSFQQNMSEELKEEVRNTEDPTNFNSFTYDTDEILKIFYSRDKGLIIQLKESILNILNPDANDEEDKQITVVTPGAITTDAGGLIRVNTGDTFSLTAQGTASILTQEELLTESIKKTVMTAPEMFFGSAEATEPLVLGDKHVALFKDFFEKFLQHRHPTPTGPSGPPLPPQSIDVTKMKDVTLEDTLSPQNYTL